MEIHQTVVTFFQSDIGALPHALLSTFHCSGSSPTSRPGRPRPWGSLSNPPRLSICFDATHCHPYLRCGPSPLSDSPQFLLCNGCISDMGELSRSMTSAFSSSSYYASTISGRIYPPLMHFCLLMERERLSLYLVVCIFSPQ